MLRKWGTVMPIDLGLITKHIWTFKRSDRPNPLGHLVFAKEGRIGGYLHPNEVFWQVTDDSLKFFNIDREITAVFKFSQFNEDFWVGDIFIDGARHKHILSVNSSTPVNISFSKQIETLSEVGGFYLRYYWQRRGVYNEGQNIILYPNAYVEPSATLPVGSFYSMGALSYHVGNSYSNLSVGRYCSIASGLQVFGDAHPTDWLTSSPVGYNADHHRCLEAIGMQNPPDIRAFQASNRSVRTNIGNDVWIGADCLLKPGITVGNGAIIAARSVVTRDVPPYAVVSGAPAIIRKYRFDKAKISRLQEIEWWRFDLSNKSIVWDNVHLSLDWLEKEFSKNNLAVLDVAAKNLSVEILSTITLDAS